MKEKAQDVRYCCEPSEVTANGFCASPAYLQYAKCAFHQLRDLEALLDNSRSQVAIGLKFESDMITKVSDLERAVTGWQQRTVYYKQLLYKQIPLDTFILLENVEALKEVVEMVEDNRKMPHQHEDYYLRLCCLAERATEALSKLRIR